MIELQAIDAELLEFFKALSDRTRLRIAGQLASRDRSAEQLAAALDEKLAVICHHLQFLEHAGLASGPAGAAQTYHLRLDQIQALAGRLLAREQAALPADASGDDYDRKVLRDFLTSDGSFKDLPLQEKKFKVLLRYAFRDFEPGRRYTEKEVNAVLARYHADTASLRRALVDYGWVERAANGREYWLKE